MFFEKNTLSIYPFQGSDTQFRVCLLLVAGISDDNVPYIPCKNMHFPHNEPVVEVR